MAPQKHAAIKAGETFSRWTATGDSFRDSKGRFVAPCVCMCGKSRFVSVPDLRNGRTNSCGCIRIELHTRHGHSGTKLYRVWMQMHERCRNPRAQSYARYGGRGILVCTEWLDFSSFRKWAYEHGYRDGLTIDREDNDLGYSPTNCRWVDRGVQSRNRGIIKTNTSGFRHVYQVKGRWRVMFQVGGKKFYYSGFGADLEMAAKTAATEYEKALLAFSQPG